MKYFSINNSFDVKILGHYPQVKDIKQNCDIWDEPKFIEHVHFTKIDFEPITANAILYPTSKLTDLISVTGMGFTRKLLLSGKFKKIIKENRPEGIQFYLSNLIYKGDKISDYWVLNVFQIDMDFIDIEKSNFVLRKRKEKGGTYLTEIKFNSLNEFNQKIKDDNLEGKLYLNRIVIKENVSEDFFVILNVEGGVKYIVSEKLKQIIEKSGCTGVEFQPSELSTIEWTMPGGEREKVYGKM